MSTGADRDREAFYSFERHVRQLWEPVDPADLPAARLEALAERLFAHVGRRPALPLMYHYGAGRATGACICDGERFTICLPPRRQRPWCVIHEAAHALHPGAEHGPAFARTCIEGWARLLGWPRAQMLAFADLFGVRLGVSV